MTHHTYPVHLLLRDRPCLVVGAGNVALRKAAGLVAAGARVTVIGPRVHPEFDGQEVKIIERAYESGEVANYRLAIACTDDPEVNRQVFLDGEEAGVWVNSADDPENCAWILPAVSRHDDLTVTVSTNGRSPALASWLRRKFDAEFDDRYSALLDVLAEVRAEARAHHGTSEVRGWNTALDSGLFELVAAGNRDQALCVSRNALGLCPSSTFCEANCEHAPADLRPDGDLEIDARSLGNPADPANPANPAELSELAKPGSVVSP